MKISNQLINFQQGHESATTVAKKIEHFAKSRTLIPEDTDDRERNYIKREPGASVGHSGAHCLGVIPKCAIRKNAERFPASPMIISSVECQCGGLP